MMLADDEKDLIDTILDEIESSLQTFACRYDDFLDLCAPDALTNKNQIASEENSKNSEDVKSVIKYATTFKEPPNIESLVLDEEKIFDKQIQCADYIGKIEKESEELSRTIEMLDEINEALSNYDKSYPTQNISMKKIRKDFLKHKDLIRLVANKAFTFRSEEFLYLLNELLRIHSNEDNFLDVTNLNISTVIIQKSFDLGIVECHPTEHNKYKLANLF